MDYDTKRKKRTRLYIKNGKICIDWNDNTIYFFNNIRNNFYN